MLSARARRLLDEALALPEGERAELAEELVRAAPLGDDWLRELDERASEIDRGADVLVDADEAHSQMRAEIERVARR
jgi:hypothetical protein